MWCDAPLAIYLAAAGGFIMGFILSAILGVGD